MGAIQIIFSYDKLHLRCRQPHHEHHLPNQRLITYERDVLGRIQSVTGTLDAQTTTLITNRTYRADGLPINQLYGNGLSEVRNYDARGNLTYQSLGSADTRLYGYDLNGNLTQKQSLPEVGNYLYDAENRLTDETTSDNQHNAFTYDASGNRTSDLRANGIPRPYAYAANSNRHVGLGNQVITLDAAGNTTLDRNGNRGFSYSNANRLTQVSINGVLKGTYTYNYLNQRTRKVRATATGGTSTFLYHYDTAGNLIAETRPNGKLIRSYLWADNEPIAQIQTKGTNPEELSYVHNDHLNTPRLATNAAQTVVWRFESDAFGTGKPDTDPDADETKTNLRLRFPGQYADGESGLYYNWNRYYDPKIGRYVTSDPIGLVGGLNTYSYVDSSPLRWSDPLGLFKGPGVAQGPGSLISPPGTGSGEYDSFMNRYAPKMGSDPFGKDLPTMGSGFGGNAANDSNLSCPIDDIGDDCATWKKRLRADAENIQMLEVISGKVDHNARAIYQAKVRAYNAVCAAKRADCPKLFHWCFNYLGATLSECCLFNLADARTSSTRWLR